MSHDPKQPPGGTGTGPAGSVAKAPTPPARDPAAEAAALAAFEVQESALASKDRLGPHTVEQAVAEAPTARTKLVDAQRAKTPSGAPASTIEATAAEMTPLAAPDTAKPPVVSFDRVSKVYGSGPDAFTAIKDVTFAIPDYPGRGEFVSILGPSGCGKSTVIRMIAGLLPQFPQTSGQVLIDGKPITGPGPDRGMVFQDYTSFDNRTVLENVVFGLECRGLSRGKDGRRGEEGASVAKLSRSERIDRAKHWIDKVGLSVTRDADKYPHQLSGGMRQRVAIARTLILEPRIILMDEPFGALDPPTRSRMQDNLISLWREQSPTIFFITHSIEEAVFLGDHILLFSASPGTVVNELRVPPPDRPSLVAQRDPKFIEIVLGIRETINQLESSNRAGD